MLRVTAGLIGVSAIMVKRHRPILTVSAVASQVFWANPKKNSLVHKVDSAIAKSTIGYIVWDTVQRRPHFSYYGVLAFLLKCVVESHRASEADWCSLQHFKWHGLVHMTCFVASLYAR